MRVTLWAHRVLLSVLACLTTTLCFGVVAAAAVMVETVGQLSRAEGGGMVALTLWAMAVVECAAQALSVSIPVACAFVAVVWARRGEAMAVAQLGLSPLVAEGPLLVGAACVCLLFGLLAHEVVPRVVMARNDVTKAHLQQGDGLSRAYVEPPTWFFLPDKLLFVPSQQAHARDALLCRNDPICFAEPVVYGFSQGRIDWVTRARALGTAGHVLSLYDAVTHHIDSPKRERKERWPLEDAFLPKELSQLLGNPREMPSSSLASLIERREAARLPVAAHRWELTSRTSAALSSFASVFALAPLCLSVDRKRTLARNVMQAAWVSALMLVAMQCARQMALANACSFVCAALWPPIVALIVRCVVQVRSRVVFYWMR